MSSNGHFTKVSLFERPPLFLHSSPLEILLVIGIEIIGTRPCMELERYVLILCWCFNSNADWPLFMSGMTTKEAARQLRSCRIVRLCSKASVRVILAAAHNYSPVQLMYAVFVISGRAKSAREAQRTDESPGNEIRRGYRACA